jgi:hypothetical protein
MVATLSAQPWLWRRNATIPWATATAEQHSAHGQTTKHHTAPGEDAGVAYAIQLARRRRDHRRCREGGQKPQRDRAGADRAIGARSTGRRSEAMATNGGETDELPRSNGRA